MIAQDSQLIQYITQHFANSILKQSNLQIKEKKYHHFHFSIDLIKVKRQIPTALLMIMKDYPRFLKTINVAINRIIQANHKKPSVFGNKISIHFQNPIFRKQSLKDINFLRSIQNLTKGGLIFYLKDVEIISIKHNEFYLQSWSQIWEYTCECKVNSSNRILQKKIYQSLIEIIQKGKSSNLKQNCKERQTVLCLDCNSSLRFLTIDDLAYDQCYQIQILCQSRPNSHNPGAQLMSNYPIKVLIDKSHLEGLNEGIILDICCYLNAFFQFNRPLSTSRKVYSESRFLVYLVCFYPKNKCLKGTRFFQKIKTLDLEQQSIISHKNINSIVNNYKKFMEAINKIPFPYVGSDTLTTLKLISLSSIVSNQINQQKINFLLITDEVEIFMKYLQIQDLPIKKFPSIYDQKTISAFLNSNQDSIILIINPTKKEYQLIKKILKKLENDNLNLTIWVLCQPDDQIKKEMQIKQFDIILDLTVKKNLNICQNVYSMMVDNFLEAFMSDIDQLQSVHTNINTVAKNAYRERDYFQTIGKEPSESDFQKQQRLANQILKQYFLKSRQFKVTLLNNFQTLTKIADSFTQLRYFIKNKGFSKQTDSKNTRKNQYLSVLDVILTIFIEEESSRNKFSSSNTFFADEVSKIMLNESHSNVSIWGYNYDQNFIEQTKNFIPRDQLVGIVINKLFRTIFEQQ